MSIARKTTLMLAAGAALAAFSVVASRSPAAREHVKAPEAPKAQVQAEDALQAGKYLVMIGGCNDCHTAGYSEKNGKVAESEWLKGSPLGFKGPWGTTYPSNLRLTVDMINEDGFVMMVKSRNARPPMPWGALHAMSEPDLRAMYQYIKALPGGKGEKAPDYLPPAEAPKGPVVTFPTPPDER